MPYKNDSILSYCQLLFQRSLLIRTQDHALDRRTLEETVLLLFCVMLESMQAPPPAMLIERDPLTRQTRNWAPILTCIRQGWQLQGRIIF